MRFDPRQCSAFIFHGYEYDEHTGEARLHYSLDGEIRFTEVLRYHGAKSPLSERERHALDLCLKFLHLAAGVSYYKAAAPGTIVLDAYELSAPAASFFDHLYLHGLGEFAFENDLMLDISFPGSASAEEHASELQLPEAVVVPIGGGKDSLVTVEIMKQVARQPLRIITVGNQDLSTKLARKAGLPLIVIERRIDRSLLALNRAGAYNGHVPITAILSFLFASAAILYGYDTVVMSNERSANVGNLIREDGLEINHQYSKSLEFEARFATFLTDHALENLHFFSLLRPLSELAIAKRFSALTDYHPSFTSCNRNFRIDGPTAMRWCLNCPKCRFVFLCLAPFMPKSKLVAIFGGNLLDDETQIPGFDALCGFGDRKPFECVGEIEESRAAMLLLSAMEEWKEDKVIRRFISEKRASIDSPDALLERVMRPSPDHRVPGPYVELLVGDQQA